MARKKKERESSLHLTDKHHPLLGIVATLLAVLSAGMFGAACVAASGSNGHAGLLVGFVGRCWFRAGMDQSSSGRYPSAFSNNCIYM